MCVGVSECFTLLCVKFSLLYIYVHAIIFAATYVYILAVVVFVHLLAILLWLSVFLFPHFKSRFIYEL